MAKNLSSILRGTNYGTLPISSGGTGVTTAVAALTALGAQAILPAANGSANGYLTSTDWTTFNSKLDSYTLPTAGASTLGGIKVGTGLTIDGNGILTTTNSGTVTSVAGTAPIASSGGATPTISIAAATTSVSGYLTSTDWNTFNSKQAALSNASTSVSGILTSTDWNTFNSKQAALVSATNIKSINGTTLLGSGDLVISSGASATKTIANIAAAYTVVAGDLGKIINCTSGTFTISLTAAATLGSGFTCTIWNTSTTTTHVITINPNLVETIDGAASIEIRTNSGVDIVCTGSSWITSHRKNIGGISQNIGLSYAYAEGDVSTAIGSVAYATGSGSIAFGNNTLSSNSYSVAIGAGAKSGGISSVAIGNSVDAASGYSTAIGNYSLGNSSGAKTATGAGAMALGGSYASGQDSFAAAVANNTSTYGANGNNSIAIGKNAATNGYNSISIGNAALNNGSNGIAIGSSCTTSNGGVSIGSSNNAVADKTFSIGHYSQTNQYGKYAYASGLFAANGDSQFGKLVLRAATTTTTAVVLTSDAAAASTTNQLIVATSQAMTFFGTLIAKQSASNNMAAYKVSGAISNNAGTIALAAVTIEKIVDTIVLGAEPTFTADSTNKALAITSGYKAATNIRWVMNIDTAEVTYA